MRIEEANPFQFAVTLELFELANTIDSFNEHSKREKVIKKLNTKDLPSGVIEELNISDTLCDPKNIEALPPLVVDEPTISITFQPNTSPFVGQEGQFVTSRQIAERLEKELVHNVALRVEATEDTDKFRVSGRGALHLSIFIETMRREGFELAISPGRASTTPLIANTHSLLS